MIRFPPLWRRAPAIMTPKYWIPAMKSDIHPTYQPVVFRDHAGDHAILTRSTLTSDKTVVWEDGETYPVIDVEVSSASHSFYTGKQRLMDTGGRLGRFQAKLEAVGDAPADTKKKKNVSRTFTPAVDPKILAAKAARAEAKAIEDAKKRAADEEAAKVAAAEAAAEKAAAADAAKAEAAAASEAESTAPDTAVGDTATAESATSSDTPAADAVTADAPTAASDDAAAETPAEDA
ncbi:MAG: ribosomal protein [Thermoleophilia bacterium]|nr:ribosomal protein [Thermoleophilia bacterium]